MKLHHITTSFNCKVPTLTFDLHRTLRDFALLRCELQQHVAGANKDSCLRILYSINLKCFSFREPRIVCNCAQGGSHIDPLLGVEKVRRQSDGRQ
jgi:hypothetical protein